MKYRFVYKNGGWWLKISTIEELRNYIEQTKTTQPIIKGLVSALNCREFGTPVAGEPIKPHVNEEGCLIGLRSENHNMSLFESAMSLALETDDAQIEALNNGESLYFNRRGGWHSEKSNYSQWYDSDKLVFPDFRKNQIKIEKFPMGQHFYAYINDMQVRDGDTLKWNTYEEAYNKALEYVKHE